MDKQAALKIIRDLAEGIDPRTGEIYPADSPYQHPDTIRALFAVLRELDPPAPHAAGQPSATDAPTKAGKPWSPDEDKLLAAAFDAGKAVSALAIQHQRSRAAIEARLVKLGRLTLPEGALRYKVKATTAAYRVRH